jgi:hypothetical protein
VCVLWQLAGLADKRLVIFDSIRSGEEYKQIQRFYAWLEISAGFNT